MSQSGTGACRQANPDRRRKILATVLILLSVLLITLLWARPLMAASVNIEFDTAGEDGGLGTLQMLLLFALLAVAPSLLVMMTSFTRIVIVFSFLRNAMGLQQTPPNQVLIGLALFLSLFIMQPVLADMNQNAVQPYIAGELEWDETLENLQVPLKEFMLKQTKADDLNLFLSLKGNTEEIRQVDPDKLLGLGLEVIVPSFITSELKRAFTIGFLLFLPFLVIDMIVSSTLMSMGMVMLPPSMISMPFKLMLFVVVDGWSLIMEMLVKSFY